MDEAGELDVRDMSTGAKDALEIPDRLGAGVLLGVVLSHRGRVHIRRWIKLIEEATL